MQNLDSLQSRAPPPMNLFGGKSSSKVDLQTKTPSIKVGYRELQLNTEIVSRETCLQEHLNWDKSAQILLVVTYHPILPTFKLIAKCHLPTFHTSKLLLEAFSLPPLIAYRHLKSWSDLLVQATLTAKCYKSPGNHFCRAAEYKTSVLAKRCGLKGTFAGWHSQHYVYAIQYLQ